MGLVHKTSTLCCSLTVLTEVAIVVLKATAHTNENTDTAAVQVCIALTTTAASHITAHNRSGNCTLPHHTLYITHCHGAYLHSPGSLQFPFSHPSKHTATKGITH